MSRRRRISREKIWFRMNEVSPSSTPLAARSSRSAWTALRAGNSGVTTMRTSVARRRAASDRASSAEPSVHDDVLVGAAGRLEELPDHRLRDGASRRPAWAGRRGPRGRSSWRSAYARSEAGSDSATSSRARSAIESRVGMFRWVATCPNWRSRSRITTWSLTRWARPTATFTATVVVPTPPFGENTAMTRRRLLSRMRDHRREVPPDRSRERWKRSTSASTRASSSRGSNGRARTSSTPASRSPIRSSTSSERLTARMGTVASAGDSRMARQASTVRRGGPSRSIDDDLGLARGAQPRPRDRSI